MTVRVLDAWINDVCVGILRDNNGVWSFRYHDRWISAPDAFALSPHLPLGPEAILDGGSVRPVQWYFDNLLPEETQRTLLAKDARLDEADAFSLLEYYGSESAGSLTLLPAGEVPRQEASTRALPDDALSQRIRNLPRVTLNKLAAKRMSLAGAQHKLAICLTPDGLAEPNGSTPSTHILKPDHPDPEYPHSVVNEWFVTSLAHFLEVPVPRVERRYVPEPVYVIERFDRELVNGVWHRRHVIDACQLLGISRTFKYSSSEVGALRLLTDQCQRTIATRTRLYQWLIFNLLVGNGDAHLKNLSFMINAGGIALSPHYDLISTACYATRAFDRSDWPARTELSWPVGRATRFGEVTREDAIEAGLTLGLTSRVAARLLDKQCHRIREAADTQYAVFESENTALVASNPDLGPRLNGESRALRTIVFVIIPEMLTRLQGV